MASIHRNISFAAAESFGDILHSGRTIEVRGKSTKELTNRVTVLERPLERFLFLPGRLNDVFAQVAETLWVLNGRDDLEWLVRYLPRAFEFSDDGKTWRAAYGPRLRRWKGTVDQLAEVRALLTQDRSSRRAVMALFDPALDYGQSLDIPCNNWLSWLIRDDALHLSVALRSNDAFWGFSGTNAFEWSVLHELMAGWTGTRVGSATFFATSFHLYEHHFGRALKVTERFHSISPYDFGVQQTPIVIPGEGFDRELARWFDAEAVVRSDPDRAPFEMSDPFLSGALALVRLKWGSEGWGVSRLRSELSALPDSDMAAAAYDHFGRNTSGILEGIAQPAVARFFAACGNGKATPASTNLLADAIKALHLRKDRDYGGAWKRRGEQVSVLPNIARKVDRLETFLDSGRESMDETLLDTAIDLYVYAQKYRLFLEDDGDPSLPLPRGGEPPSSDEACFDALVDLDNLADGVGDPRDAMRRAIDLFEGVWKRSASGATLDERRASAASLAEASGKVVATLARERPAIAGKFVTMELHGSHAS